MSRPPRAFASERDFAAQFLLPTLKEAADELGVSNVLDFHLDKTVDGIADLTVERAGRGLCVLEAKFKKKIGRIERDIEPRDPDVISQAVGYASTGGYRYYATCNTKRLILFQLKPGVKAYESEIAAYDYERKPDWAIDLLKTALEIVPVRLKPIDDTLVDTLHEAAWDLHSEFLSALKERLKENRFKKKYVDWLEKQGLEFSDETDGLIAEQSTYLQINKLLFYQVIRTVYPERLKPLTISEEESVSAALTHFFKDARRIDYEPIYESDIISEIPLTKWAEERLRTLIDTLNQFDFSRMESDFLGQVYEKLIPPIERKRLGQFYTPPSIVDFIIKLTVTDPNAKVLDPGCGSGGFLVSAYHQLKRLNGIPQSVRGPLGEQYHKQLLNQVYGIDINQFPAHLSVINLAIQNSKARIEKVNVLPKDFFEVKPGQAVLVGFESITTEGKKATVDLPPYFNVVVANPPYIRQELLGEEEKKKIKQLIESEYKERLFIGTPSKKDVRGIFLDKQSDIYIYFFIHGLAFLNRSGRLGFISSNKWLEVGYGEPFQQLLLDNAKILYTVEFDRAIFPDAEVNTAVTILEKEPDKESRKENLVKFVRVKQRLDMEKLQKRIQETQESLEDDALRINIVEQESLKPGKWNIYLRAPIVYKKIVSNPKVRNLEDVSNVFFGIKTGHNPFFLLNKEEAEEWKIESNYLQPCVYSPKDIRGLVVDKRDIDRFLFTSHDGIAKLRGTNALRYIRHGEKLKVEVERGAERKPRLIPDLESVKSHKPFWYSLPKFEKPQILLPKLSDMRLLAVWNRAGAQASDLFYYVVPKNERAVKVLLAYLNSSVGALIGELYGRSYGGGVLDIKVYEAKQFPIIDPSELKADERQTVTEAFDRLAQTIRYRCEAEDEFEKVRSKTRKDVGLFEREAKEKLDETMEAETKTRKQLDEVIYDILGLSKQERLQVERGLEELQELRRLRAQA